MTTTQSSPRRTDYFTDDLGLVATVRYQGGWHVRLAIGPDEFTIIDTATREYAEAIALRHARSL